VQEVVDRGGTPGRTRLVKLLYLFDVAHAAAHAGETYTGARWKFLHYGPYAAELQTGLDRLVSIDLDETEGQDQQGRRFFRYKALDRDVEPPDLEVSDRQALRRIVDHWGAAPLNELLDHVYFETAPMADVRRGEPLDLKKAAEKWERTAVRNLELDERRVRELRRRIESRAIGGVPVERVTRPPTEEEARALSKGDFITPRIHGSVSIGSRETAR
jgi:hypothetical protein